jgi:hypothetical protein
MSVFDSDMTVRMAVDRTDFHPGDSVTAHVVVAGEPDKRVQGGRVEIACVNRFLQEERDYNSSSRTTNTRTVTREEAAVVAWQPLPGGPQGPVAFGEHTVTLTFPPDAPPTAFEPEGFGDMVRWEVRAILDRKMAFDPDATQVVTVYSRPEQYGHWGAAPPVAKSSECPMGLDLSARVLRPDEQLTGVLRITAAESIKGRSARVQLERRRTDTPDNIHKTETLAGVELAKEVRLDAGESATYPFQIPLPRGVPPSFAAHKSNMHWFVEGVVDRKLRGDFVVEAELVVYTGSPGAPAAQPAPAQPAAGAQPAPTQPAAPPQPAAAPPAPDPGFVAAGQAPGTPAGWYADPWLHARLRYWDGNAWTGHTAA